VSREGTISPETLRLLKEVQKELGCAPNDKLFPQHTNKTIKDYFSHFFVKTAKV
jgi:hypothetical protein